MRITLATLHVRRGPQAVALATASVAAALPPALREHLRLVDLFPDMDEETMATELLAGDPELLAFSLYLWNRASVLSLCRRLKTRRPGLLLIAGGPEAGADPAAVLAEGPLDGVLRGEGETGFPPLAEALSRGERPERLPGVVWRRGEEILSGPEPLPPLPAEALPSPWLSGTLQPMEGGGVLWETSRGCAFGCDYCYDGRGSRSVRHLPLERLGAELDLFIRSRVGQVWILDSTFNFPPERGRELLKLLSSRAPHLHFHLEAKAEFLDRPTVGLLAGLNASVQIGLQSVRPEVLRHIHRQFDRQTFHRRVQLLNQEGVTFGFDLIYGLPGDDYPGFSRSLEEALELLPNHVELFPLALLPGTVLHRNRERFALEALPHPPYTILATPDLPPEELARCRRLAAAADLFYNVGRAVAFLPALRKASGLSSVEILERFALWARGPGQIQEERLLAPETWSPRELLPLQEGFTTSLLKEAGRGHLVTAALDLLRFHFHYAETLLGEEGRPALLEDARGRALWDSPWRLGPGVRLVPFRYEVFGLQEMENFDLETFTAMFRPVGSVALFQRRGGEVLCESLEEEFLKLLRGSDGTRTPREIFGGSVPREEGEEIVEFALAEGFLGPADLGGSKK